MHMRIMQKQIQKCFRKEKVVVDGVGRRKKHSATIMLAEESLRKSRHLTTIGANRNGREREYMVANGSPKPRHPTREDHTVPYGEEGT